MRNPSATKAKLIKAIEACTEVHLARNAGRISKAEAAQRLAVLEPVADKLRAVYARQAA